MPTSTSNLARSLWQRLELIHTVVYFAPESQAASAALKPSGVLDGVLRVPLGGDRPGRPRRGPGDLLQLLAGVDPPRGAGLLDRTTPAAALEGRQAAIDQALRRLLGEDIAERADIVDATAKARPLAESLQDDVVGRPLFAGHADQPWPDGGAHMTLWWAATLVREHRGDGHIAALVDAGVDGCEALVLHAATGVVPREALQPSRKWTDDEWAAAVDRLAARGWVDATGAFTDAGRAARDRIEDRTDEMAMRSIGALGNDVVGDAANAALPIAKAVMSAGGVPPITPVGAGEV